MASASRVIVAVAGAVVTIVVARVLGPKGWAAYFVAQSLVLILVAGCTLGIEHGITYFVSSGKWSARAAFESALKVAAISGCAGASLGLIARLVAPSAFAGLPVWLTAVAVAGLPFALAWLYTSYVALATDRYEVSMSLPAIQAVLVLGLALPGAILFGLPGSVVGMAAATVVAGAGAAIWGKRRLPRTMPRAGFQIGRAISFGIKGYAANALQFVNYRLDLFILSAVASAATVGSYALAVSITSLLWLLPSALSDVVFPRIARLSGSGEQLTRDVVETKSLRHVSLIVATTALVLALALELLVVPVFGQSFRSATNLGLILLPGAAAIGVSSVLAAIIVGRGRPVLMLYGSMIVTPVTIALYASLIPALHANGAALASTLSYCSSFVLLCSFYRRVTGRKALPLFVPTRAELADWQGLPRAVSQWAEHLRKRPA